MKIVFFTLVRRGPTDGGSNEVREEWYFKKGEPCFPLLHWTPVLLSPPFNDNAGFDGDLFLQCPTTPLPCSGSITAWISRLKWPGSIKVGGGHLLSYRPLDTELQKIESLGWKEGRQWKVCGVNTQRGTRTALMKWRCLGRYSQRPPAETEGASGGLKVNPLLASVALNGI